MGRFSPAILAHPHLRLRDLFNVQNELSINELAQQSHLKREMPRARHRRCQSKRRKWRYLKRSAYPPEYERSDAALTPPRCSPTLRMGGRRSGRYCVPT
ncbi:hypothetical protein RSSE_c3400 [Ralstonia solanacearum]|nr:hypothetical protein RSSE_c3400 [Ralstonia solanacearum]